MTRMYKFLRYHENEIKSDFGNHTWEVGKRYFLKKGIQPKPCKIGFHASPTPLNALRYVRGEILALVSGKGIRVEDSNKTVFSSMKLIQIYYWTPQDSIDLACFSATLVLPIFENEYPNDDRPRKALAAAKSNNDDADAYAAAADASYAAAAADSTAAAYAASAASAAADAAYAASDAASYAAAAADSAYAAAADAAAADAYAASFLKNQINSQINNWILTRAGFNND